MAFFTNILFGKNGGLTHEELHRMTFRNRFSDYLPYVAYDDETEVYLNSDHTAGFLWECTPLVYASPAIHDGLRGLFTAALPPKTILQFILYADPYIKPVMDGYQRLRERDLGVVKEATTSVHDFMSKGAKRGIPNFQGIPVRNFRLFFSLKLPLEKDLDADDIRDTVYEILKGSYLFPEKVTPHDLISFLMRLFC
ncbi:MAG: conjugal transfer protein TraC, partial [Deltaproteobacteria bacterium]|nr:conjugal transfer protein TraC [Deltaproteobacteria bacterium]